MRVLVGKQMKVDKDQLPPGSRAEGGETAATGMYRHVDLASTLACLLGAAELGAKNFL